MENMFFGASKPIFENAAHLRKNQTKAEEVLWKRLNRSQLGVRFKRQHPISYFIADFYCHKVKLVIEVDGKIHDVPDQKNYDINRTMKLEEMGIKVIRFTNDQIFNDLERVVEIIQKEIQM